MLAVGRERLRVSRDLHDLLGQSLSAVSLKGDLAIRLLHTDPDAARAEIDSLTDVARDALRGVRAITLEKHTVSLPAEIDGATVLLEAAGVQTRVEVALAALPMPVEEVLAWTVREGVTNVLRHSRASACAIRAGTATDRPAEHRQRQHQCPGGPRERSGWSRPRGCTHCPGRHCPGPGRARAAPVGRRAPREVRDQRADRRGHAHDPRGPGRAALAGARHGGRRGAGPR